MQITEIDPNKKYVLVLPEATREFVERLIEQVDDFRANDKSILVIFGTEATIVPIDQVVGCITSFER